MKFSKYHALGNDYIVVDPKHLDRELAMHDVKVLCDRNYGVGSDGVLYGPLKSASSDFRLRIFNPDASEAEKSGNGLRIFSRYLWDTGLVADAEFTIETSAGAVAATVIAAGALVSVDMGVVRFTHENDGAPEIKAEYISSHGRTFQYYRANVGNPHCVIPVDDELTPSLAALHGSQIENDKRFSNRTNVQFVKVLDANNIQIEIWERGAGYTLASGSSSTAAAAAMHALGLCEAQISVKMPGGTTDITLDREFQATMKGPVVKIADGIVSGEAFLRRAIN